MRGQDDISSRMLIAIRDYAAMKLGTEVAYRMFDNAVRETGCTVARATDPRAWVPLEALGNVARVFEDSLGPTHLIDAATWVIPWRREYSAMSLSAFTTADMFYVHLDRARSFFARHVRFEMRRVGPGHVQAALHYREDVPRETRLSCMVGRAVLHAVPLLFDLPPAKVAELGCRNDGAETCTYDVTFRREAPLALAAVGAGAVVAGVGALLYPTMYWLAAPTFAWVVGREIQQARTRRFMARVTEEHRRVLAEHESEFQRRYDEIKALNDRLEQRLAESSRARAE